MVTHKEPADDTAVKTTPVACLLAGECFSLLESVCCNHNRWDRAGVCLLVRLAGECFSLLAGECLLLAQRVGSSRCLLVKNWSLLKMFKT